MIDFFLLLLQVTLNKRKKGLIKKAMEISLLTGVNLILTIFDKEEGKVIQYLSDSVSKFQAINQLTEMEVRKRYASKIQNNEDLEDEEELKNQPIQYVQQNIVSEIYTNDHYDYLFNNGPLPEDLQDDSCSEQDQKQKSK